MWKKTCIDCRFEWITGDKEAECPSCAIEQVIQRKQRISREAFIRKKERARQLAGIPANDRMELCEGCELPLAGNSYFDDEDGEKQRICDSCGHAHRVPTPPMMYMMNEKDWRSRY